VSIGPVIVIGAVIGLLIGIFIAGWQLGKRAKRAKKHNLILHFLESGQITVNEARKWRNEGKPPSRITSGALSPYEDG
jgi:hypothetical protein